MKRLLPALILILSALPLYGAAAAATSTDAADGNDYKLQLFGWSYGRERKTITGSNRVTGTFKIKNVSDTPVTNVILTVTYKSGLGEEVAKPVVQKVGTIKPGDIQKTDVVGEFIPIFNSYDVLVEFDAGGHKKEAWFSNSDTGQPQPKNGEPIKGVANVMVLGREAASDRTGKFSGTVRVKNEGTAQAKNVRITVTFFDTNKKKISEWSDKLGSGTLDGGTEENIPFTAARAPKQYGGYEIKVGCEDTSAEAALSGTDFTNVQDVEFAKFDFKRPDPKSKDLKVAAQVRNGLASAVEKIKLTLSFQDAKKKEVKNFTFEVPGQLKPGEVKPVEFTVGNLPKYEAFEQQIGYSAVGAAPAPKGVSETKIDAGKFENKKDVEVIFTDSATNEDKSVSLAGSVRNGKPTPVKDIAITAIFTRSNGTTLTTAEKTLTDVMHPGEERNFVLKAPSAAGFSNYTFSFKYVDLK